MTSLIQLFWEMFGLEDVIDMIFLGTFFCGDIMSIPCTPTNINHINCIELKNGEYDDLFVTKDTDTDFKFQLPAAWDFNTLLYAKFDDNTLAGNIGWSIETVSNILIKRRKADEFKWITLSVHPVTDISDFNISGSDITGQLNWRYQYAAVPVLNGIEGNYSYAEVECMSDKMLLADMDEVWTTEFTDGFCDSVTNSPVAKVETLYHKYPTIIKNGNACYEDINFTISFFEMKLINEETGCRDYVVNDRERVSYQKRAKDFINNGKIKLIKNIDGRMWLVYVTTATSDSADGHYQNRKLSFTCTEVGDPTSEEDLFNAGFITSTSEWWNQ